MYWVTAIFVYFVLWWISFLMVLPFGVQTAAEQGQDAVEGQAESAPQRPALFKKVLAASFLAAVLLGIFIFIQNSGWITIDTPDVPKS